jgi:hypothetical protein
MLLQGFHHVPRQYIRAVRLAGVQLDACFACDILIDPGVDRQQSVGTDISRKKYFGFIRSLRKNIACSTETGYGTGTQHDGTILKKTAARNFPFHVFSPFEKRPF